LNVKKATHYKIVLPIDYLPSGGDNVYFGVNCHF
jgi:hypothetical protein